MPNDFSVHRVAGPPPPAEPAPAAASAPLALRAPSGHEPAGHNLPNPTLRLDPALGMVVIEFRDDQGAVKSSIPTEQQLDAYRTAERTHSKPGSGTV